MKNLFYLVIFLLAIFVGCDNNSTGPVSGGGATGGGGGNGGGGGGGTGNVTITTTVVQDNQGQQFFQFAPSTSVVVDQIRIQCTAQQVDETVQGDGQTVYTQNDGFSVGPITQGSLQSGQQWIFTIQGKIGSSTGTAYNATSNYTVP